MNEEEAYEELQELLALAEHLENSGRYSLEEIINEIKYRIDQI